MEDLIYNKAVKNKISDLTIILMLKFCDKCESKLIKTKTGLKCQKCDDLPQITKNNITENKIGTLADDSFPFEIKKYYEAGDIRKTLVCDKMSGINYHEGKNFLTLIRYAHELKPNPSNPYLDVYDKDLKKYYYTGKGGVGDQTLTGVNDKLVNADNTNTTIHLFWQHNTNSKHEYIGQMHLENYEVKNQRDKKGDMRKVFVFTLRP